MMKNENETRIVININNGNNERKMNNDEVK